MPKNAVVSSPLAPSRRIVSIDALRGFAILGILIMNIQSFSMVTAAYMNPAAYGDLSGINRWVWIISYIIADKKFMTIFAMLFGAGIVLMTARIEEKGQKPASVHYRRTLWLILIGLAHAHLLWHGDILVNYGLCGLIAYLFRKKSPGGLLAWGIALFSVASLIYFFFGLTVRFWPEEAVRSNLDFWKPGLETVARELEAFRGGWLEQMPLRTRNSFLMETFVFLIQSGWRTLGLMLAGMAFYKWGIFSGERSRRFYFRFIAAGLLAGLPLVIYGARANFAHGWKFEYSMFLGWQWNYWGSVFISCAYIGGVALASGWSSLGRVPGVLAAVGRMALTNYLAQTLICTTIFYGHGFGLFGRVERMWHPLIIAAVWIVQLVWSPLWLKYFRFGPAEWLWRSLTYLRFQPIRADR